MPATPLHSPVFSYTTSSESGTEHSETLLELLDAALEAGDLDAARDTCAALRDSSRSVRASASLHKTLGAFSQGKVTANSSFSFSSR
jgi:hypothetical protein